MEFYDDNYDPYELTHWGIKGMKWGVRRFQNKDGSLTAKGGKRYNGSDYQPRKSLGQKISDYKKAAKKKANLKKAREARAAKKEAEEKAKIAAEQRKKDVESGKIKAKDMTNEELRDRINRMNDEKRYNQLMEETGHNSMMTSYGKKFAQKMWNEAIQPALIESGKQILKDKINDAVKKSVPVEEFDIDKFWKNRNKMSTKDIQDVQNRLNAENAIEKMMARRKSEADAAKKTKEEKKLEKEKAKREQDMKDYEAFQEKERKSREGQSSNTADPKDEEKWTESVNQVGSNPTRMNSKTNSKSSRTEVVDPDAMNPARFSKVTNYPAVANATTKLSKVQTNSKEYADKAYKGEQYASEILDADGNVIAKFNKNGKRRLW